MKRRRNAPAMRGSGNIYAAIFLTQPTRFQVLTERRTHQILISILLLAYAYAVNGETLKNDGNQGQEQKALKVLTLNVAHGRKDAINQMLLRKRTIENNLADVATLITTENPHVVALQEADGPSRWSGNFDHVRAIADSADYPWYFRAEHAKSPLFAYGTAILSRLPVSEKVTHTFAPSPPTLNKGFLLCRVKWNPYRGLTDTVELDVVSTHLDFSRYEVRKRQVNELIEVLSRRDRPLIVLGDFNSDWHTSGSLVRRLTDELELRAYMPEMPDMTTYPKLNRRLDWVLISKDLKFISHTVVPDIVSDHLAVTAEIVIADQ